LTQVTKEEFLIEEKCLTIGESRPSLSYQPLGRGLLIRQERQIDSPMGLICLPNLLVKVLIDN
jgi:hypothetical protein